MERRFVLEFGFGVDLHGQDVNKAAEKAVKDAISRSCLCGLAEVLDLDDLNSQVCMNVTVAVSEPEKIKSEDIEKCLPIGKVHVNAVKGGMRVNGMYYPKFGDKDETVEAAVACVEVIV